MASANGKPQFDFSNLSWGDDQEATLIGMKTRKAREDNDVEGFSAAMNELNGYVAKVLRYVPREWLVSSAPEKIDWSDPDNLKRYVRADKFSDIQDAMGEEKKGNSDEQSS
jgi:hypothetical protein